MIELLGGLAALLGVLLIVAVVFAVTYRQERDEALMHIGTLQEAKDSLALSLKAAEMNRDKAVSLGIAEVSRVSAENVELQRQIGRMEAEARAEKLIAPAKHPDGHIAFTPARDSKGKFLPKPKAPKPPKDKAAKKPKPVACG